MIHSSIPRVVFDNERDTCLLSVCLSISLFVCLAVFLSVCLSACLSVGLPFCLCQAVSTQGCCEEILVACSRTRHVLQILSRLCLRRAILIDELDPSKAPESV